MNNVEQEFFEAFGIEKGMYCYYCDDRFNCFKKNCKHPLYPSITPEIVLGLEEVILDKYVDSLLLTKIKDRTFEYRIGYSNYWNNIVQADTRKDALLKLCIQLKYEIQEQVKELFNGK